MFTFFFFLKKAFLQTWKYKVTASFPGPHASGTSLVFQPWENGGLI